MPTGVGQHINGMFSALQQREDVEFHLATPRDKLAEAQEIIGSHSRSAMLMLPWPDRWLRVGTTWTPLMNLDRWLDGPDWVYTPVEQPVTTNQRLAVTVHDLYSFEPVVPGIRSKRPAGFSWRRRMKRLLERADLILAVSEFTRSRMLALFDVKNPARIVVLGNGGSEGFSSLPQTEDADVLRRFRLNESRYVLFPASLTQRKAGDLLLDVVLLAHREQTGLHFAVVGRRHEPELLEKLERLKNRVPDLPLELLGYVTKEELAALYRHAKAALFPSRYEGFGIPIVEALASGCPILIAPHPALLEVASGRAVVVDPDAASVLARLTADLPRPTSVDSDEGRTWTACAARLIHAMQ